MFVRLTDYERTHGIGRSTCDERRLVIGLNKVRQRDNPKRRRVIGQNKAIDPQR